MKMSNIARFVRDPRVNPVPKPVSRVAELDSASLAELEEYEHEVERPVVSPRPVKKKVQRRGKLAGKRGELRTKVLWQVEQEPGLRVAAIAARAGMTHKQAENTLNKLRADGVIKSRKLDGFVRFYPASALPTTPRKISGFTADGAPVPETTPDATEKPVASPEPVSIDTMPAEIEEQSDGSAEAKILGADLDRYVAVSLAKEYYWRTGDTDLRKFVKWVEGNREQQP